MFNLEHAKQRTFFWIQLDLSGNNTLGHLPLQLHPAGSKGLKNLFEIPSTIFNKVYSLKYENKIMQEA